MTAVASALILKKLAALRVELVDLAFVMDRRGRSEAADVAMTASARIGELCQEFETAGWTQPSPAAGTETLKMS